MIAVMAFSCYIFVTELGTWPWNGNMKDTVPYMFNAMLGNYDSDDWTEEVAGWQALITFILFQFFAAVLLLNLLIAVLSDVYARVHNQSNNDLLLQ